MAAPNSAPTPLGDLEIQALEYLWQQPDATAKEFHEFVSASRPSSLNTVQSAMERLFRKGLADREKVSHSYRYSAKTSKTDLLGNLINDLVGRFNSDSQSSAAAILNAAEQLDEQALDLLEKEINRRKQQRLSGEQD
ncbi:BlaI/MecI/CopY family transcriptional regulator [Gilvimarinus sp. SDUM040013]|nr:BlaI/MecI/CopY family transcriptional regulator [Gilvimarinus sp. SDUM040013]MDO3385307.1 BlaI/MecI/CopY family transcriptional regulator [Gilvimarinus sp. SDUM040013]